MSAARRMKTAVAGLVAIAGMAVAGVATAPASQAAASDCTAGYLCFWVDGPFAGGSPGKVQYSNDNWAVFSRSNCPGGTWDNCASSIWNRTSGTMVLFDGRAGTGASFSMGPGVQYGSMPWLDPYTSWNDRITSNRRY